MWDVLSYVCLILSVLFLSYILFAVAWRMRRIARLRAFIAEKRLLAARPEKFMLTLTRGMPFETKKPSARTATVRSVIRGAWRQYSLLVFEFRRELPYQIVSVKLPFEAPFLQVTARLLNRSRVDVDDTHEYDPRDPVFARQYRVHTNNDQFAAVVLDKATRGWLVTGERQRGFQWTIDGENLVSWRHGPVDAKGSQGTPVVANFLVDLAERLPVMDDNGAWRKSE